MILNIGYEGTVNVKITNNNLVKYKFTTHNAGTENLFKGIAFYMQGASSDLYIPKFIDAGSEDTNNVFKSNLLNRSALTSKYVTSVSETADNKTTVIWMTTVSGMIDGSEIADKSKAITELILGNKSSNDTNDILAKINVPDNWPATISSSDLILVEWQLKFSNK